jgi:sugar phosphate isomerase/epimerase
VALTAENWPIAASMLSFPAAQPDTGVTAASVRSRWVADFGAVAEAGFDDVDVTDSWVRPGDLDPAELDLLAASAAENGLRLVSISSSRRSVIDAKSGEANLAYGHRTIDAAAVLGIDVVSVGLHQPLTDEQRRQLWFWTVVGHVDPADDREVRATAVRRLRELGQHAADLGILLSLELYEHTYLGTGESAVRLVEEIGLPNVGLNPDIGNLIRLHEAVEDWRSLVRETLPYANFWHAKNYSRDEHTGSGLVATMPSYLESGVINYREAIAVAISVGFQGIICTEHYGGDGLSMIAANRDYLRGRILPRKDTYPLGTSKVLQRGELVGRASGGSA